MSRQLAIFPRRLAIFLRPAIFLLLTVGSLGWAAGYDFRAGPIGVDQARAAPSATGQREDAAFMTIENSGKDDDVLVGVTCAVVVKAPGEVPRSQGKAVRVKDHRHPKN